MKELTYICKKEKMSMANARTTKHVNSMEERRAEGENKE